MTTSYYPQNVQPSFSCRIKTEIATKIEGDLRKRESDKELKYINIGEHHNRTETMKDEKCVLNTSEPNRTKREKKNKQIVLYFCCLIFD